MAGPSPPFAAAPEPGVSDDGGGERGEAQALEHLLRRLQERERERVLPMQTNKNKELKGKISIMQVKIILIIRKVKCKTKRHSCPHLDYIDSKEVSGAGLGRHAEGQEEAEK